MAESSAALFHRSGTEQLEHWAALGAAVESVLGLSAVARFKTLGRSPDIDTLIARAGTPAANRKLAQYLGKQVFPQYAVGPEGNNVIATVEQGSGKRPGRAKGGALNR